MAKAGAQMRALSDEQLVDLIDTMKGADTVELKLTVPEENQRSAITALEIDPLNAEIRQVYFFDTPDLTLDKHGLVVRARRVQRKGDDSVVKLRPVVPADLPDDVRSSPAFGVEVDAMPGGFVCSASMKGIPRTDIRQTLMEKGRIRKLFTKEQRAFYAERAPTGVELDELTPLGPFFVLKLKFSPQGYERKLVAEMWLYPDGSRILELSTKCLPADTFTVAAETRAYLAKHGVDLTGEQQTKTRTALSFFSEQMQAGAPGSAARGRASVGA